jgi:hypothetical protein
VGISTFVSLCLFCGSRELAGCRHYHGVEHPLLVLPLCICTAWSMHECANAGGPRAKELTSSQPLAHEEVSRKNRVQRAKQEQFQTSPAPPRCRLGRIFYYAAIAIRCDPPGYPVTRSLGTIRLLTLSHGLKGLQYAPSFLPVPPSVHQK